MKLNKCVLLGLSLITLAAGCNKPGAPTGEKKAPPTPPVAAPAHTTDSK